MAKTSNLREFQEAILLRLKDVAAQGDVVSTSRLGVTVGSKKLLINLNDVTENFKAIDVLDLLTPDVLARIDEAVGKEA